MRYAEECQITIGPLSLAQFLNRFSRGIDRLLAAVATPFLRQIDSFYRASVAPREN